MKLSLARCPIWWICAIAIAAATLVAGCAADAAKAHRSSELKTSSSARKQPPGAVDDAVTAQSLSRTICAPGWVERAGLSRAASARSKAALMRDRGVPGKDAAKYRLDHLIPIAIGGHPELPENLWLQPLTPNWDVHTKDRLGVKLHAMVCRGELSLKAAQDAVRSDWRTAVRYYLSERDLLVPIADLQQ